MNLFFKERDSLVRADILYSIVDNCDNELILITIADVVCMWHYLIWVLNVSVLC